MSRLEGGPGTCLFDIAKPPAGALESGRARVPPAPAAVPVERLVGIGLVRPDDAPSGFGRLVERPLVAGSAKLGPPAACRAGVAVRRFR